MFEKRSEIYLSSMNILINKFKDFRKDIKYITFIIIIIVGMLLIIEYRYPYFFLQDDNRDSYLPYIVHNYDSIISGEIPLYNFHQFMGVPSLAQGQTGALYPITYLSVFLSKALFFHVFASVDIFVGLHLCIGAVGFFYFSKFLKLGELIGVIGSLMWATNTFAIYVSNSWMIIASLVAYLPWMFLFSFKLTCYQEKRFLTGLLIVTLLLFYSGNVQYFIYSVIFVFFSSTLYSISLSKKNSNWNYLLKYLSNFIVVHLFALLMALPLLLPMWNLMVNSVNRSDKLPFVEFVDQFIPINQLVIGLFNPFYKVNSNTYAAFRNLPNLSHIGYIPIVIIIYRIFDKVKNKSKINQFEVELSVFIRSGMIALLWSTNWIFNLLIYAIPILNRFRWPFKILIFFNFYFICISISLLWYYLNQSRISSLTKESIVSCLLIVHILSCLSIYLINPHLDFGEHHADEIPLHEPMQSVFTSGRIISVGFNIWTPTIRNNASYRTAPTMGFNYATLWGLNYFAGYNVLLSEASYNETLGLNFTAVINGNQVIPIDTLREAGVKWYIIPTEKYDEFDTIFKEFGIEKYSQDDYRIIYYDSNSYALVYKANNSNIIAGKYRIKTNEIELQIFNTETNPIDVYFNFVFNPNFVAYVDGKTVPIRNSNNNRMVVSCPKGQSVIRVVYRDKNLELGIIFALFSVFGYFVFLRIYPHKKLL
jgi:hypothetical protein